MNTVHSSSGTAGHPMVITQIADGQWQAVQDDQVVGHGDASHRPDGRVFLSIDAWDAAVFDRLAQVMRAGLPTPLYTLVDEADADQAAGWERAGFTMLRREWEYAVPTDPRVTGLDSVRPPSGVTIVPVGEAEDGPLRVLDRLVRAEVEATVGWRSMPAEVLHLPQGVTVLDPSKYAVAAQDGRYVGLLRLAPVPRYPRIGLIAVRAGQHRRGIARALLAQVLGALHRSGVATAAAEVSESNLAAKALFEGVGAQCVRSNLELVLR
ncbi:N-acetyltransferase family protein [Kitasatospora sp. McL0602]|uniref:GNAT family N-acetyltransferase n=1 Tax=Kitasatospora sp. McL0602 TaxID=3439530 RepID=UPI003F88991C